MSVLHYGLPNAEVVFCENPICAEKATFMATEMLPPADSDAPKWEVFGCNNHINQLTIGRRTAKLTKLRTPGERNKK